MKIFVTDQEIFDCLDMGVLLRSKGIPLRGKVSIEYHPAYRYDIWYDHLKAGVCWKWWFNTVDGTV